MSDIGTFLISGGPSSRRRLFKTLFALLPSLFILLSHGAAAADTVNGTWVNYSTITVGTQIYFDAKGGDSLEYKLQGGAGCTTQNVIKGFNGNNPSLSSRSKATLYTYAPKSDTDSTCVYTTHTINLANPENFDIQFVWVDSGSIVSSDKRTTFTQGTGSNSGSFYSKTGGSCSSKITPSSSNPTTGTLIISVPLGGSCYTSKSSSIKIEDPTVQDPTDSSKTILASNATAGTGSAGQTTGQNGHEDNATCETSKSPLTWILCPIFNGVADMSDWLFSNMVKPLLHSNPISTDPSDVSYKIWSNFRIYGDIFLVIALIVIVFGQSIGGGLVDAYTAKKVLPRLLAAAILVNLSLYIVAFMVDITNVVGGGLGKIITGPLAQAGAFNISPSGIQQTEIVGAGGVIAFFFGASILGALFTANAGIFILLFVLMPAVLGMIAAFVTLIMRQAIILALIIVSPVAFALYCLPNTEQYFRKWWTLLIKTLLVYPIVIVIFAVADVLSVTVMNSAGKGSADPLPAIISFLLQFLPLIFIPFAFRMAGGAIGQLHDSLTGLRKRSQEAVKGNANDPGSLRNRTKRDMAATLARKDLSGRAIGTRLDPRAMRKGRRQSRTATLGAIRNHYDDFYGKQGAGAAVYESYKDDSNVTGDLALFKSGKESREVAAYWRDLENNKVDSALTAGTITPAAAATQRSAIENTYQQKLFSSGAADQIGRTPGMRRRALMNPATIGYELGPGEDGWKQATGVMRDLSGGDEGTYRSLMNEFQYIAKAAAGRTDLAAAVDGGEYDGDRAWSQESLYAIANGKPTAIKGHGQHFAKKFASGSHDDKVAAAVFYKELEAMKPNAKGGTRDQIVAQMEALDAAGMKSFLNAPVTVTDPATGAVSSPLRDRVTLDPSDPNKKVYSKVAVTNSDTLQGRVRAYERPDPNHIT